MGNDRVITVERTIPAPPERIFDIIADPRRHPEIDGSGMVQHADVDGPRRLSEGSRFGMAMKLGLPYRMVNEVTEFEENRRIAWAPRPEVAGREVGFGPIGGRIWSYELEPSGNGSTVVRETWDASRERGWFIHRSVRTASKMRTAMQRSLENLERLATA